MLARGVGEGVGRDRELTSFKCFSYLAFPLFVYRSHMFESPIEVSDETRCCALKILTLPLSVCPLWLHAVVMKRVINKDKFYETNYRNFNPH